MPRATGESRAVSRGSVVIVAITVEVAAEVGLSLESAQRGVKNHVDHPCHRIRTIGGRGSPGYGLDAADQHGGDDVQIDRPASARRDDPPAVHECQRPGTEERIQPSQVGERGARVEVASRLRRRAVEPRVLRQLVQYVPDVGQAQVLDLLRVQHGDRVGRGERAARDASAGHRHFLELTHLLRSGRRGRLSR